VPVTGLSSGVAMVALGGVRHDCDSWVCLKLAYARSALGFCLTCCGVVKCEGWVRERRVVGRCEGGVMAT
jgi:hypothetical protein